jgi:cell division protein FtsL
MGMFIGCLLLTLFLNTFTEQASFQKRELQTQIAQTTALRQRLEAEVARTESPENLLTIAKKMGMVPAAAPVFLRLSDHKILGKPIPAAG